MKEQSPEEEQNDLRARIQEIEEHSRLGAQLEGIIADQKGLDALKIAMDYLPKLSQKYQQRLDKLIELEERTRSFNEQYKQQREDFARKYAAVHGGEENARAYFDVPTKNPERKAYINLAKGVMFGTCSLITWPFSRKLSNSFLKLKAACFSSSKSYFGIIAARKKQSDAKDERLKAIHENEFLEAKAATILEKDCGLPSKAVEKVLQKPELVLYATIHSLKDKYAPWL